MTQTRLQRLARRAELRIFGAWIVMAAIAIYFDTWWIEIPAQLMALVMGVFMGYCTFLAADNIDDLTTVRRMKGGQWVQVEHPNFPARPLWMTLDQFDHMKNSGLGSLVGAKILSTESYPVK